MRSILKMPLASKSDWNQSLSLKLRKSPWPDPKHKIYLDFKISYFYFLFGMAGAQNPSLSVRHWLAGGKTNDKIFFFVFFISILYLGRQVTGIQA